MSVLNNKHNIYMLLSDGQWHSNREVQEEGGFCYTARISELRKDGYIISCRHVKGGKYEYHLDGRDFTKEA